MKIINETKNTLYVSDLEEHMPYRDNEVEYISPDKLKRSKCLRSFILSGILKVVEHDPEERIEASLMYMKKKLAEKADQTEDIEETEKIEETPPPPLAVCDGQLEVKIHGIFYDASGYGKVNRNLAICLEKAGVKVQVDAKRGQNQLREDELAPIVRMGKNKVSRDHIRIDSIIPSFADGSSAKYKILYTTIESYTLPDQFAECCQMYDEIWLTSEWSASVLRKHVDKPVYAVITGVDTELYTEKGPRFNFKPNIKDFVFVSVFGWNYRKGYDVLLKAYFDEFDSQEEVSLLIVSRFQTGNSKYHRSKIENDIDEIMKNFPNKDLPHVARYSQVTPEKDMPKIYRAADAFILTSRGEGGNLPALEATMCGLPVIMTNCSGQQGYLDSDHAYLIEIDRLVEMQRGQMHLHYWDGQQFPALTSPEVHQQVRQTMRHVFEDKTEPRQKNIKMQRYLRQRFTWAHTTNSAIERLKQVQEKLRKQ